MLTRLFPFGHLGVVGAAFVLLLGISEKARAEPVSKPSRAFVTYFGDNVVNPGASLGYEAAFYYRRPHEIFGGARLGGYSGSNAEYYGLFFNLEGGYRLNFRVGFFIEARVGIGYLNLNRNGGTMNASDGSIVTTPNTSSNYLLLLGMGGLGWDFLPATHVPLSIFADVGGLGRYNQAESFGGGLVLTTGLAYQFGTRKPQSIMLPVRTPEPAFAPAANDFGTSEGAPPSGPAEPMPPTLPEAKTPHVEPVVPPEPPLPPPPTVLGP